MSQTSRTQIAQGETQFGEYEIATRRGRNLIVSYESMDMSYVSSAEEMFDVYGPDSDDANYYLDGQEIKMLKNNIGARTDYAVIVKGGKDAYEAALKDAKFKVVRPREQGYV